MTLVMVILVLLMYRGNHVHRGQRPVLAAAPVLNLMGKNVTDIQTERILIVANTVSHVVNSDLYR